MSQNPDPTPPNEDDPSPAPEFDPPAKLEYYRKPTPDEPREKFPDDPMKRASFVNGIATPWIAAVCCVPCGFCFSSREIPDGPYLTLLIFAVGVVTYGVLDRRKEGHYRYFQGVFIGVLTLLGIGVACVSGFYWWSWLGYKFR